MLGFAFGLPFCVPNLKAIEVRVCLLQQFLQVCEKTKKKKKKKKTKIKNEILAARISEMAGAISFKFGMLPWLAGNCVANLVPIR